MTKEEAVELLQTCTYFGRSAWEFEEAKEMAIRALTADVKPVARGEWQERVGEYPDGNVVVADWYCSVCGEYGYNDFNFCPNCGMPMTEEALKILARRDGER